jgi:hypothetical protein
MGILIIFEIKCKNLVLGDFDRGVSTQNKWQTTPYTLGPSFNSFGQVFLGLCP